MTYTPAQATQVMSIVTFVAMEHPPYCAGCINNAVDMLRRIDPTIPWHRYAEMAAESFTDTARRQILSDAGVIHDHR